jgi:sugar phosphate isomerase/epimerase
MTQFDHEFAQHLTRRQFATAAVGGMAAVAGGVSLAAADQKEPATLSPLHAPFDKMKLSLAAYSLRKYLQQNWPNPRKRAAKAAMTMADFVDYCGKLKLDGCEPTSYYFPNPLSVKYLEDLRERAKRQHLAISATAIGNDFCVKDGPTRKRQLQLCRQWVDYAAVLGAPSIRIFAGKVPRGDSEAAAIERCVAGINESVKYAAKKKVALALENHGGITATPKQMLRIISGVTPSPYFGVNFDGGNFRTDDPYRDLAVIAPYAINAQLKLSVTRKGKREPADMKKTLQILKRAGYRGWVALEYEEREEPKKEIPKVIHKLRDLMAAL